MQTGADFSRAQKPGRYGHVIHMPSWWKTCYTSHQDLCCVIHECWHKLYAILDIFPVVHCRLWSVTFPEDQVSKSRQPTPVSFDHVFLCLVTTVDTCRKWAPLSFTDVAARYQTWLVMHSHGPPCLSQLSRRMICDHQHCRTSKRLVTSHKSPSKVTGHQGYMS